MHGEQIKLKADSPQSRFPKEPISPALLKNARAVNSQKKKKRRRNFGVCLFLGLVLVLDLKEIVKLSKEKYK